MAKPLTFITYIIYLLSTFRGTVRFTRSHTQASAALLKLARRD